MLDPEKLIEFLKQRAATALPDNPPMLVRWSIYQGLIERIQRGDFDE